MLDPITLDQLRAFIAVVEEGSFSAAARKLQRVQSAVSTAMANLEAQLGVQLWDRSTKVATLTEQGQAVLAAARRVCNEVNALRKLTAGMHVGLEATVSLCVDVLCPTSALVDLCVGFAQHFPGVDLRIDTQTLSTVSARVLDGRATLGVVSPLGVAPGLESTVLAPVRMIPVVAPTYPLAAHRDPIPTTALADCIQIVLSERQDSGVPDQAVLSPRTWRVCDLHTKHAMLRAGLGWGNLPEHIARDDLRAGRLVKLRLQAWGEDEHRLYLSAVYRSDQAFGPAHRWLLEHLKALCLRDLTEALDLPCPPSTPEPSAFSANASASSLVAPSSAEPSPSEPSPSEPRSSPSARKSRPRSPRSS
ncbi:LysR family transcriptional regulator [Chondromyces crocatus]|uniref:LysR family transcriptional regulator n=1 Tax=Chondromyces crocatus TaxID=52 RepID=A0A0K1ELB7_CHOCO|nr:LysR family transcriptional regulator [Chondromyces crocatus]AKT41675.1 LysR family transcriptional regulator [Chondromyces crocatus]